MESAKILRARKGAPERVAIWGAGGHAKVVAEALRGRGFEVAGFIDDRHPGRRRDMFYGARVFSEADGFFSEGVKKMVIAIGENSAREQKARQARSQGYELVSVVHCRAFVATDVELGQGTIVMAGAVINAGSKIGRNVIVNTLASIDHDCVVADGVHISPGVRIAGRVNVGRLAWVGIAATVIGGISIGENALIGAGAVVIKDVPADVVVAGVPARIIKQARTGN